MYLVSNEEMRQLDRTAIETWRIPSLVLMENAGIAILRQLERDVPGLYEKRITILCGCGNNGGNSCGCNNNCGNNCDCGCGC